MPRNPTRDVILSDEQIALIVEGLVMLRLHENGNPNDVERVTKTAACERLENRLRGRLERRQQGVGRSYAERL